jgi:hypothetical protein
MTYPSTPVRTANYYNDEQNHLTSPDPAKVDTEMNSLHAWAAAANALLRAITTAAGALKNVAAATAQSLAGSQTFTATASQTAFLTTIDWVSAFTSANVAVFRNGTRLPNSSIAVASGTGTKLQVTIPASTAGDIIQIDAYESGAGLLTSLAGTTVGTGAELIGVYDPDGKFTGTTVNDILRELVAELDALTTAIGAPGNLIRADGTVAMAAALAMGTHKITGLVAGTAAGHAVEYAQFEAVATLIRDAAGVYLKLNGEDPMEGSIDMGASYRVTNMADPVDAQDAETKAHALATLVPRTGDITLTGTLGGETGVADTDFTTKAQVTSLLAGSTGFQSSAVFNSAGTTSWTVPAGVTKAKVHCVGGGGGGGAHTTYGGGGGGYAQQVLSVTPGETLTLVIGAGGATTADGGTTEFRRGSDVLVSAGGGKGSSNSGVGGSGTTGAILLSGGHGDYGYNTGRAGNAAGPYGGQGGGCGVIGIPALPGHSPGGGGGSGGSGSGAAAGAAGAIIVEY